MSHFFHRAIGFLASVLLCATLPAWASMPSAAGERAIAPKPAAPAVLRLGAAAPVVALSPVADAELAVMREANRSTTKRVAIGIVRSPEASTALASAGGLRWVAVPGGFAAQAAVRSPDAGSMRLAIDLAGVPSDLEMVFFGSDAPERLVGPVRAGDIPDRSVPWWSPLTDGDTQTVEFFVASPRDRAAVRAPITAASHVFTTLASRLTKRVQDIGAADACEVDVQCSALSSSPAFLDMRNAVAQMVFNDAGAVHLCTGQLVNDTDPATQIPWFYSADHCFDNELLPFKTAAQMQAVASTLNTFWFFEAASCNARSVPSFQQLTNGATFIYNNPGADALFLRLNDAPPAGAFYVGWDANPVAVGASFAVVHHPWGDLKKVTQGRVIGYSPPQPAIPGGATASFSEVVYSSGTSEPGGSGAGLYTFDGAQYRVRGALYGGGASCDAPRESDWYSQFDKVYAALAQYLSPAAGGTDYSDLWFDPNESGWGVNIVQHDSRNIFAVWFTYAADGTRTWFVIPGGTWVSANVFTATMYSTAGPAASQFAFDPARVKTDPVGTATFSFSDPNHGTFAYSVNGTTGTKIITRQPY